MPPKRTITTAHAEPVRKRGRPARAPAGAVNLFNRTEAGIVMTFGMGDMGQLGYEAEGRKKPKIVPALKDIDVVMVECGGMHTAALSIDGKVYTWGVNDEGALGRTGPEGTPLVVEGALTEKKVVQVSCGDSHTAALCDDGSVYHWGIFRAADGKFGLKNDDHKKVFVNEPVPVPGLSNRKQVKVIKIVSGADHILALTATGVVYSWGCHEQGRLGRRISHSERLLVKNCLTPQIVFKGNKYVQSKAYKVVDVFAGSYNSFALLRNQADMRDTRVFAWGANGKSQCGLSNKDLPQDAIDRFEPEEVVLLSNPVSQIAAGNSFSIAVNENIVWATGKGDDGALGTGLFDHSVDDNNVLAWVRTSVPNEVVPKEVSCGAECSYLLSNTGDVYAWGFGENMQLGNGQGIDDETPSLPVPTLLTANELKNRKVLQISGGGQHVAVIAAGPGPSNAGASRK
eukprot:CFRG5172T1